jgi:signal transduction histidine kinase
MLRLLTIVVWLLSFTDIASAGVPLLIEDTSEPTHLMPSRLFQYYQSRKEKPLEDAQSFDWHDAMIKPYRTEQGAVYQWIKFSLRNDTADVQNFILYHASNLTLENMEVYRLDNNGSHLIGHSGAELLIKDRSIKQRLVATPVNLAAGEVADLIVHAHTTRPFKPDFAITSVDDFNDYIQSRNLIYGFCMGIEFIVFLISAVFAYRLRDKVYAWFSVMALSMLALVFVSFGFKDASPLFSLIPISSTEIGKVLRPSVTMMVLNHTAVFLSLRTMMPVLNQWFQATILSLGTLLVLSFAPGMSHFAIAGGDRLIFLGMILTATASLKAWRRKIPQASYFMLATGTLIFSVIPWLIIQLFALPAPRFALDMVPIGPAIQMCFLTLGLMAKVRSIDEARAKAEIEAGKNEELKSLVRVLSHDLSNPISVVMAYAQKGMAKCFDNRLPEISLYFQKILKASENQITIIDHIKSMRAVQDGKSSLHLSKVPLIDVFKQCEITFEQSLQKKNLRLVYDTESVEGLIVMAEASSLNHNVINNLVSNAIKFSHPGSAIEMIVDTMDERIAVTVADQGIGIPKEMLANIFRADKPTSRLGTQGEQGTGYGMPLVQSYMQKFGGDISIDSVTETESPERHGTRVTVSFKKAA